MTRTGGPVCPGDGRLILRETRGTQPPSLLRQGASSHLLLRRLSTFHLKLARRDAALAESCDLTAVIALQKRDRSRRMGARWLQRWDDQTPGVAIDDAAMAMDLAGDATHCWFVGSTRPAGPDHTAGVGLPSCRPRQQLARERVPPVRGKIGR